MCLESVIVESFCAWDNGLILRSRGDKDRHTWIPSILSARAVWNVRLWDRVCGSPNWAVYGGSVHCDVWAVGIYGVWSLLKRLEMGFTEMDLQKWD